MSAALDWLTDRLPDLLRIDAEKVRPDARLDEQLAADSIDVVEIAMAAEDFYDVELSDDAFAITSTVAEVAAAIEDARAAAAKQPAYYTQPAKAVLGADVICSRCGATLSTYADACTAHLGDACPGFVAIEAAVVKGRSA